jgi:adenosylcobinamide-phosphate synthase
MVREMAAWMNWPLAGLAADPALLVVAVIADLALGDPVYAWHPVRVIGRLLSAIERGLWRVGLNGYGGGILLFVLLESTCVAAVVAVFMAAAMAPILVASLLHVFAVYSLLALGDLLLHVRRIERAVAADDLPRARQAVSALVGRDTDRMDGGGCRRAAVESLSENLTDGFVSPVFWYVIAGLPGLLTFKVVSTMDSMVGYKNERYLRFGWCGARLDDVMNYVPARLTWLVLSVVALLVPACSARKAWGVGLGQHALLLGPNSGWSEAATAGAIQRRIVGPIWLKGVMVTDLWIGDPLDPVLETAGDVNRAVRLTVAAGLTVVAAGVAVLLV